MSTVTIPSTLICQSARGVSTANGRSRRTSSALSVAPSTANSPPMRKIAVEAKKVQPWSTEPWIIVSTIRMNSRSAMTVIQPCR